MAERWALVPMAWGTGNRADVMRGPAYVWTDLGDPRAAELFLGDFSVMPLHDNDDFALLWLRDVTTAQARELGRKPGVVLFPADLSSPVSNAMRRGILGAVGTVLGSDLDPSGFDSYADLIDEILARIDLAREFYGERIPGPLGSVIKRRRLPTALEMADPVRLARSRERIQERKEDALVGLGLASKQARHLAAEARTAERAARRQRDIENQERLDEENRTEGPLMGGG